MSITNLRRLLWLATALGIVIALAAIYWNAQRQQQFQAEFDGLETHISALGQRLGVRETVLASIRSLQLENPSDTLLFAGETAAVAAAALQGQVKNIIEDAGGSLLSTELLPPSELPPFQEIGVSVQFIASITGLRDTLYQLDKLVPATVVTQLSAGIESSEDDELRISMHVRAFAQTAGS